MKSWGGRASSRAVCKEDPCSNWLAGTFALPLLRMFSQPDGAPEGRPYFGYTLQPATLV
jgi:hypothetical protein